MKIWLVSFLPFALLAQDAAKKEESPAPATEQEWTGSIDLGARWRYAVGGDFNTYRSIVNLGSGLRLVGADVRYEPSDSRLFDSLLINANNWGGDPYNTARFDLLKRGKYRFAGRYSNIAYFNYLPSFANPGVGTQFSLNQRAYDTTVRNLDTTLELFPGTRVIPYVSYERNTDYGNGVTTLVEQNNEYPLRNLVRWGQDRYLGGVRLEWNRWHATVEGGQIAFKDDQSVTSTQRVNGNRTFPYLGQQLFLSDGTQLYHTRSEGSFTRAALTANPWNWLDLAGNFMYSKPEAISKFSEDLIGSIAYQAMIYSRNADTFYGNATMPRTSWSGSAEARPFSRLRIREIFESDRMYTDSNAIMTSVLFNASGVQQLSATANVTDRFEATRYRNQIEGLFDITKHFMVRGGFRNEWGASLMRSGFLGREPYERGELERRVGLIGAQFRAAGKLTVNADYEIGDGVKTYYRTGLMDTKKYRIQGRYSLRSDLTFNALFSRLENKNPDQGINYNYHAQAISASLQWTPAAAKRFAFIGDYSRSAIMSDINYLDATWFRTIKSLYRDNAHSFNTYVNFIARPSSLPAPMTLSVGGSFVTTSGSRPSRYYQPQGKILIPIIPKLQAFGEWRWFGLNQPYYSYEGFRANMILAGFRFLM